VINAGDILRLDFTLDLTQGGISYACYSLPQLYTKAGYAARNVLRHTVAQVAVEIALRRHLVEKRIPFEVRGAVPFTAPNHFDVMLRGQRCDIRTFLITNRNQIHSIQMDPGLILEAPALVPVDQYAAEGQSNHDLYLIAFALGTNADSPADGGRSRESEGRMHLVHVMPGSWAHPRAWIPLGPLVLKSEDLEALALEIGGQDRDRGNLGRDPRDGSAFARHPGRKRRSSMLRSGATSGSMAPTSMWPAGSLGSSSGSARDSSMRGAVSFCTAALERGIWRYRCPS
jgi:hypothetical protein